MVMLPAERAMLRALAKEAGLKESDIIRQMIRRDYAASFGKKKPGEPVPSTNSAEVREGKKARCGDSRTPGPHEVSHMAKKKVPQNQRIGLGESPACVVTP
jgi:hypothetical protein